MITSRTPRLQASCAALCACILTLVPTTPAAAHGGVVGPQDVWQDYGVLLFLFAVVLIGAGVVAWVTLSPTTNEVDDTRPAGDEPSQTRGEKA